MSQYDALSPVPTFNTLAGFPCEERALSHPDVLFQLKLIEEEMDELDDALLDGSVEDTLDALADIIVVTAGMIHRLGYSPNDVMRIVNESNASKFCTTLDDAEKSVLAYTGDTRYHEVHWQLVEGIYVIYGKKAGVDQWKILKGMHYREPDFGEAL